MTCQKNDNLLSEITEIIFNEGTDGLNKAAALLINEAMRIDRSRHLHVEPYERSQERQDYANGFKNKTLKTRIGELDLRVPQVRTCDFYPTFLEKHPNHFVVNIEEELLEILSAKNIISSGMFVLQKPVLH